jgi:hypothetical protein
MPRVTINTQEAVSFELAEPGPYLMTIDKVGEPRRSESEKKTLGIDIEFAFADPDIAQRCGRIRRFYPIAGKGAGFFADLWKTVTGEDLPIGREGGDIDVDTDELLGKTVQVDVTNESGSNGDDKLWNTAKKVVAAG